MGHNYQVTLRDGSTTQARGESYAEAADRAAKRQSGRQCIAVRDTGERDGAGWFTAHQVRARGGSRSTGEQFHLQQLENREERAKHGH